VEYIPNDAREAGASQYLKKWYGALLNLRRLIFQGRHIMANKTLFSSATSTISRADVRNEAGGLAYRLAPKHALAQLAATGCFNGTYYADAATQLDALRALVDQVDENVFLAKLAVYSRERAFMKDMPAALLLVLARRDTRLFQLAFDRVVDNGRVLRTLFQMVRSGQFGRKSLSSSLQRAFQRWLNTGVGRAAVVGLDRQRS
jgi:60 kDa SS-A/Ro ribonucleoprotein